MITSPVMTMRILLKSSVMILMVEMMITSPVMTMIILMMAVVPDDYLPCDDGPSEKKARGSARDETWLNLSFLKLFQTIFSNNFGMRHC